MVRKRAPGDSVEGQEGSVSDDWNEGSFDQRQKAKLGDVAVAVNDGEEDMFKQAGIAAE